MEFLHDVYIGMFFDDFMPVMGKILCVLIWACTILVVGLVLYLSFYLIDSSFREERETSGTVMGKYYKARQVIMQPISTGKTTTLVPVTHPESWNLTIKSEYGSDSVSVSRDFYNRCKDGTRVRVSYVTGRLSGGFYIKQIL